MPICYNVVCVFFGLVQVVHLKRFNDLGNNRWVKSQKVVHFPYDHFDPTPYLASIPQETILRHLDLKLDPVQAAVSSPMSAKNFDISEGSEDSGSDSATDGEGPPSRGVAEQAKVAGQGIQSVGKGPSTLERRKRLISTSLTKTPVMDGDLVDYHNHRLKAGYGEFDLKYSLYAVVVSIGAIVLRMSTVSYFIIGFFVVVFPDTVTLGNDERWPLRVVRSESERDVVLLQRQLLQRDPAAAEH